jgi:hypothetical protein
VEHVLVLGFVAGGAPVGVVAGLLAAAGVASGDLEMAVGDGADPDVGLCGRDDEGLDASEGFFVADGLSRGVKIAERFAGALAGDTGLVVVDVAEACGFCGGYGVG